MKAGLRPHYLCTLFLKQSGQPICRTDVISVSKHVCNGFHYFIWTACVWGPVSYEITTLQSFLYTDRKKQLQQECIPVGCVQTAALDVSTSKGWWVVHTCPFWRQTPPGGRPHPPGEQTDTSENITFPCGDLARLLLIDPIYNEFVIIQAIQVKYNGTGFNVSHVHSCGSTKTVLFWTRHLSA